MATNKLIKKTLGNINIENGIGTPNHNTKIGSIYTDYDSGILYSYDGFYWKKLNDLTYGDLYVSGRTSTTTITTGFQKLTIPMTTKDNYGVNANNYEYDVLVDGDYYCAVYGSIDDNSSEAADIYLGVSTGTTVNKHNNALIYTYSAADDIPQNNLCLHTTISAISGDTISLYTKGLATNNIIYNDLRFYINKL